MKKIPTIFIRNPKNMSEILPEPHPDCQWVFNGEGKATRKYDGSCCKIEDGALYKRREVKVGKPLPLDFTEEQFDQNTGKRVGWVPVGLSKEDRHHREAFASQPDGTYELCGPKVQDNPEGFDKHVLICHSAATAYDDCPRDFEGLKHWLEKHDLEGIVFHHPDGRMAKIKKRDFGLKR